MDYRNKTETLMYHGTLSAETVTKMKEVRKAYITLSSLVESLGKSREVSEAFTCLETSLMYAIKHLCMADPQATLEEP